MNIKDQLTPEEYKRVIHVITHFQLGSRVNDFKTIKNVMMNVQRNLKKIILVIKGAPTLKGIGASCQP